MLEGVVSARNSKDIFSPQSTVDRIKFKLKLMTCVRSSSYLNELHLPLYSFLPSRVFLPISRLEGWGEEKQFKGSCKGQAIASQNIPGCARGTRAEEG